MAETCSVCGKTAPQPTLVCMKCSEGIDAAGNPSLIRYCDTRCQSADAQRHGKECKESSRRLLERAGDLLQAAFYTVREKAFDLRPVKVEKIDGVLHCYEDWHAEEKVRKTGQLLFPFPYDLVSDSQDRQTLLAYSTCSDALAGMYELSKKVLSGLVKQIDELNVSVKKAHHYVVRHDLENGHSRGALLHNVLAATGNDDNQYIIDITGAQFRQYSAVLPTEQYVKEYIDTSGSVLQFGTCASEFSTICGGPATHWLIGDLGRTRLIWKLFQQLDIAVEEWEAESRMSVQRLVRGSSARYESGKASLLDKIKAKVVEYIRKWESLGYALH